MKNQLFKWCFTVSILIVTGGTNLLLATNNLEPELTEAPKNITWVDIVIDSNDLTLEDLASTYYGDVKEAEFIYESNKDVISKNRRLKKGMKLKIVVNNNFIDQPEHLGWH